MTTSQATRCLTCGYTAVSPDAPSLRCTECGRDPLVFDRSAISLVRAAVAGALVALATILVLLAALTATGLFAVAGWADFVVLSVMCLLAGAADGLQHVLRRAARLGRYSRLDPVIGYAVVCSCLIVPALLAQSAVQAPGNAARAVASVPETALILGVAALAGSVIGVPAVYISHRVQWRQARLPYVGE